MSNKDESRDEAKPIEHLVGSVLTSIVKAQGLAASQLVDMIDEIGFEPRIPGEPRETRNFSFDYFRDELDEATNRVERRKVTASVPLLTLVNLPTIAIDEAKIRMDLRMVAQRQSTTASGEAEGPLQLFAVPAKKQLVRGAKEALAVDSAGTIKIEVTMRQQAPMGLDKIRNMLEGGASEAVDPDPLTPMPSTTQPRPAPEKTEPSDD